MKVLARPAVTVRAVAREVAGARRVSSDPASWARLAGDSALYRALRLLPSWEAGKERTVRLKGGVTFTYRLNRGDIQSVREVWLDEAYRLPFPLDPKAIVDLGANIGLTSLYLGTRYPGATIVAVEAMPENARLTERNLARNHVPATVVAAAVGPVAGVGRFQRHRDSNRGRLGAQGEPVEVVDMASVLDRLPGGTADLVKVDIEGGEGDVLGGAPEWLDRVRSLIVEFHPTMVDYPGLVASVQSAGFRYIPANSAWYGSMDCFVRDG